MTRSRTIPRWVLRTVRDINAISEWSGKLFAWLIVPMTGALVYEVFARYGFSAPTIWAYDITYMMYGSHFMLGAAYTLARGGHIRTDFFYRKWSPRIQGLVDTALYVVLFFPAMGLFTYLSFEFAIESWVRLENIVTSPWNPPVYPFKSIMPLAGVLILIQGVSELLQSLCAAKRNEWPLSTQSLEEEP